MTPTAAEIPTPQYLDRLAERFEAECRSLAPLDLTDDIPLYIVWAGRFAEIADCEHAQGFVAGNELDLMARNSDAINWMGRGPAMVLYDRILFGRARQKYPEASPTQQLRIFECFARQLMLHEFGHLIDNGLQFRPTPEPTPTSVAESIADLKVWCETREDTRRNIVGILATHSARWLRIMCHLANRTESPIGNLIMMIDCVGMGGIAIEALYTLGADLDRSREKSFQEILATPAPREFTELYQRHEERVLTEIAKMPTIGATLPDWVISQPELSIAAAATDPREQQFFKFLRDNKTDPTIQSDAQLDALRQVFEASQNEQKP